MSSVSAFRLIVLRHAKSAYPDGTADHERPLSPRGLRDAPAAGRWLHDAGLEPDMVICSTARRARASWEHAGPELGATPHVVFEDRVYEAPAATLLDVVREAPSEMRTVLLIGHQPGVQELVTWLALDGEGDSLARAQAAFPTSAVAVLTLPGTWAQLTPYSAVLTAFTVPRGRKQRTPRGHGARARPDA